MLVLCLFRKKKICATTFFLCVCVCVWGGVCHLCPTCQNGGRGSTGVKG